MLQLATAAAAEMPAGWCDARGARSQKFGNLGAVSGDTRAHLFAWQAKRDVDHTAPALRQSVAACANGRDFERLLDCSGNRFRPSNPRRAPTN
jgi:hypothetical protein